MIYLLVVLLWLQLALIPRTRFAYGLAGAAGIIFSLFSVMPLWQGLVYFILFSFLWNIYVIKVNIMHPLFMAAYVSLFTGVWLLMMQVSPGSLWLVWFLAISGGACFIAWHRSRQYNTPIG